MRHESVDVGFHVEPSPRRRRCSTPFCRNARRVSGKDCLECHARWMREHRPKHAQMTAEQRARANARSYVHVLLSRGKLRRGPCADCGRPAGPEVRPRQDDPTKPSIVRWACDQCERQRRQKVADQAMAS